MPPALIRKGWIALFFIAIAAGALRWWPTETSAPPLPSGAAVPPAAQSSNASNPAATQPRTSASQANPLEVLIAHSSLRDTAVDGDWGILADGSFRPGTALRRRFDYYLSLQGELALGDIGRAVEQALRRSHSQPSAEAAVLQVMALWQRYLQLQQHAWQVVADPRDAATLSAALAERVPVRRQYLGADVADAFYRDEEQDFRERVARMNAGLPAPPTPATAPPLLPDADARLAALRAEQAAWTRRMASSRQALAAIRQNPALSALQRETAVNNHLEQNYAANEQVRARALLGF